MLSLFLFFTHLSFAQSQLPDIYLINDPTDEDYGQVVDQVTQDREMVELLRLTPGLQTFSDSGNGLGHSRVGVNGAEARHTNVYLNGIQINDPSLTDGHFDFMLLGELGLESAHVYSGVQASQRGEGAIGGAIEMITPSKLRANKLLLATGDLKRASLNASSKVGESILSFSSAYKQRKEESLAANGDEQDGVIKRSYHIQMDHPLSTSSLIKLAHIGSQTTSEFDKLDSNNSPEDSLDNSEKNIFSMSSLNYEKWYGQSTLKVDAGALKIQRFLDNNSLESTYVGESQQLNIYYNNQYFDFSFKSRKEEVVANSAELPDLNVHSFSLGQRHLLGDVLLSTSTTFHEVKKIQYATFSIAAEVEGRYGKDHLGISSNINAPTSYQFYSESFPGCDVGNAKLDTEKSRLIEYWHKFANLKITLLQLKIEDYIDHNCNGGYLNIAEQTNTVARLEHYFYQGTNWSFVETIELFKYERSDSKKAMRRPSERYLLKSIYTMNSDWSFSGEWLWEGSRYDEVNSSRYSLDPYSVVNLSSRYSVGGSSFKFLISNIFDSTYQLAKGYNTPRRKWRLTYSYIF